MRRTALARTPGPGLKRGQPLKRTAFKVKPKVFVKPERPPVPLYRLTRQCEAAMVIQAAEAVEKHEYIRSPKLMKAYRAIPCQHCGREDGTVCGAHSNWGMGKGKSIKADDNRCASLCQTCHSEIDQGSKLSERERVQLWWPAHVKTVAKLLSLGLWVKSVPVPDTSMPPWQLT